MGMFDFFRKEEDIVDLSRDLSSNDFNQGINENSKEAEVKKESLTPDEKRRRFVKRISEMIEKVENMSTKIFHLEQRIEVLEKKLRVNNFRGE